MPHSYRNLMLIIDNLTLKALDTVCMEPPFFLPPFFVLSVIISYNHKSYHQFCRMLSDNSVDITIPLGSSGG